MDLIKAAWSRFSERKGTTFAAAIGYRAIFALAPLLVVVVSGAGRLFGEEASLGLLAGNLNRVLGADLAGVVQDMIVTARGQGGVGVVGFALLLLGG